MEKGDIFARDIPFKKEFDELCKQFKWKKNRIIEQVVQNILLSFHSGKLDETNRNITITLTTSGFICKS